MKFIMLASLCQTFRLGSFGKDSRTLGTSTHDRVLGQSLNNVEVPKDSLWYPKQTANPIAILREGSVTVKEIQGDTIVVTQLDAPDVYVSVHRSVFLQLFTRTSNAPGC